MIPARLNLRVFVVMPGGTRVPGVIVATPDDPNPKGIATVDLYAAPGVATRRADVPYAEKPTPDHWTVREGYQPSETAWLRRDRTIATMQKNAAAAAAAAAKPAPTATKPAKPAK